MVIPDDFKATIQQVFGENGRSWLTQLDQRIAACFARWHLEDGVLAPDLSLNLVCFAHSPDYGPVTVKIGVPHSELYTEMEALSLYQDKRMCRCYEVDRALGAMLLERIVPGYDLLTVSDEQVCLAIAAQLIAELPFPLPQKTKLPAFSDWLERAFARVRREQKVDANILFLVAEAERLFAEIERSEKQTVLLHGDLHHKNILYDGQGQWRAIDPKGVIGIPCMESGRFMQNHLGHKGMIENGPGVLDTPAQRSRFEEMITQFSSAFDRPPRTLAVCAFVDFVLSRCWTFTEHLSPQQFADTLVETRYTGEFYLNALNRF